MSKLITRLTLSVLLALGVSLIFALGVAFAQGPDGARELPPITEENVADFTVEELTAPVTWGQLSPRERRIVEEAMEAGVVNHSRPQDVEEALSPGVDLSLSIQEASTYPYDPTYEPGTYFLYSIRLRNSGEDEATGVRLTYTPPVSASFSASFNERAIPYSQESSLVWDVSSLASGDYYYFYVEMRVYPTATIGSKLFSTATVTCTEVVTPVQETETDYIVGFNLDVTKSLLSTSPGYLTSSKIKPDSEVTYRIQVENESVVSDALDVVLTDTLPSQATFVGASEGGVYSPTAHIVTWDVGTLHKSKTKSFLVTVRTPITPGLPLKNVAEASTSITETNTWDNSCSKSDTTTELDPNVNINQFYQSWGSSPVPGGEVEFRLDVDNVVYDAQQVPVENVVVTETLEGGLEYVSSRVVDDGGYGKVRHITPTVVVSDDTTITWDLGTLPNDPDGNLNNLTIYLQARVPAGAGVGDVLTATASVTTTTQPETSLYDNDDQDTITVEAAQFDLVIDKYSPSSPQPGEWYYYWLDVLNSGNVPITDAIVIDYLPAGLTVIGGSGPGCSPVVDRETNVVTWTLGTLAPDDGAHVELVVRVSDALTVGHVLTNTAIVTRTAIVSDVNPGDNRFVYTTTVGEKVVGDTDIYVGRYVSSGGDFIQPGETIKYNVYLRNWSGVTAENTVLTDTVLTHATLISATADEGIEPVIDGNTATWGTGDRSASSYFGVYVEAQVDPDLVVGQSFANIVWASTTSPESYTGDNYDLEYDTIAVPPQESDVEVWKRCEGCLVPGGVVTFSIDVDNNRAITATNVVVTDTLPAGLTYLSSPVTPTVVGQDVIWNLGDMAPYQYKHLRVSAMIAPGLAPDTILTNTVMVTAGNEDIGQLSDNVDYLRFQVYDFPQADLAVYKYHDYVSIPTSHGKLAYRGLPFDYNVYIYNNSGCAAEEVVVRDVLPDGLHYVTASLTPTVVSGQVITWNLGTMPAGSEYIQVTVLVDPDVEAGEVLKNCLYASSNTHDPYPGNNTYCFNSGINESLQVYLPLILRNY